MFRTEPFHNCFISAGGLCLFEAHAAHYLHHLAAFADKTVLADQIRRKEFFNPDISWLSELSDETGTSAQTTVEELLIEGLDPCDRNRIMTLVEFWMDTLR